MVDPRLSFSSPWLAFSKRALVVFLGGAYLPYWCCFISPFPPVFLLLLSFRVLQAFLFSSVSVIRMYVQKTVTCSTVNVGLGADGV